MSDKNKKEPQIVTINDKDYKVDDLSEKQLALVNHVADLDRKIQTGMFNIDQLKGGREYFMKQLEEELEIGGKD
tara:strand:- start:605 stop:826 length:222 start_codon:yes stop_codon:yes gene_type:complete